MSAQTLRVRVSVHPHSSIVSSLAYSPSMTSSSSSKVSSISSSCVTKASCSERVLWLKNEATVSTIDGLGFRVEGVGFIIVFRVLQWACV